MTRKEAKELLPIIQAYAEGKTIQYKNEHGSWIEIDCPIWSKYCQYRIKPQPKYRPFNSQEECWNKMHNHPDFGWLTRIGTGEYTHISAVFSYCILFDSATYKYEKAFKYYTFTDGTPFGIKEQT